MANIGAAKSRKFAIGTSELRIGPLNKAGKLTQDYTVGLVDSVELAVEQTVVDLKGGFPQTIMDSAVTDQSAQITAACREFSRRNLGIMLNQGLAYTSDNDTNDAKTTLSADAASGATSITLAATTGFTGGLALTGPWGGWISIYNPASLGTCIITRIQSIAGSVAALDPAFPLPEAYPTGSVVAKLAPVIIGNVTSVPYFSAQLVNLDRASGRPRIWNFWKVANGSGLNLTQGVTDFGTTNMVLKVLQPSIVDYSGPSGQLYHIKDLIEKFPMGMGGEVSDDTAGY